MATTLSRNPNGGALSLTRIYAQCARVSSGCLLWKGAVNAKGYPFVYDPARRAAGHSNGMLSGRVAVWKLKHRALPGPGTRLVTTCRNRLCLKHEHLARMSYSEAHRFAGETGAYSSLRRRIANTLTNRRNSPLAGKVTEIRARLQAGETAHQLAPDYGVLPSTLQRLQRGATWRPLPCSDVFNLTGA